MTWINLKVWVWPHERLVLVGLAILLGLAVMVTLLSRLQEPEFSPEQLWKLKKEVIRLLEDNPFGLESTAVAGRLEIPERHLRMVMEQLIQDRFVVTDGAGGQVVYKLKRFQGDF